MGKRVLPIDSLLGGEGEDKKVGVKDGFWKSQNIDFRSKASRWSLLPRSVKESASVVTTAVQDAVRVPDGSIFFMGGSKIYRRNKEAQGGLGTYTEIIDAGDGLESADSAVYNKDRNKIYIPDGAVIHTIDEPDNATTSTDFNDSQIGNVLDYEVDSGASNIYTLPTSISEAATARLEWQPEIEPLIQVALYLVTKGAGDVTVTIHDATNATIATKIVTAASLTAGAWNIITFDSNARLYVKPNARTYHVHATVASGTTTVRCSTTSNFSTARVRTYAQRLVPGVYHPVMSYLQYVVIGNERYISLWEPITDDPTKQEFEQHRLKLPSDYKVIGLSEWEEMLVISAKKTVSSDYGSDDWGVDANEGLLLFWDGTADTYNWFKKVTDGAFESIYSAGGLLWGYINGVLHVSSGDLPIPLKSMRGVEDFVNTNDQHDDDVYLQAPYKAMTMHKNIVHMGFPFLSVNDSVIPAIYSYGSRQKDYPEAFGLSYTPSHGDSTIEYDTTTTPDTPLSGITYLGRFGANMFSAWQHGASDVQTFGIDVIKRSNEPSATGYVELFEFDDGLPHKQKQAIDFIATYESLPVDATITLQYKIDHETNWKDGIASGDVTAEPDKKKITLHIEKLFHTIDLKCVVTNGGNGSPLMKSLEFMFDDRSEEKF